VIKGGGEAVEISNVRRTLKINQINVFRELSHFSTGFNCPLSGELEEAFEELFELLVGLMLWGIKISGKEALRLASSSLGSVSPER